ncbi:MAG: hypothetical protein ONB14_12215, partial [candidate division KSB1 bacterium]|nr:hypothetical protein [candidate division KSB1 bacterium]
MKSKLLALAVAVPLLLSVVLVSAAGDRPENGMSKREYYQQLMLQRGQTGALAKPGAFKDRKYGRLDVGKIRLEINNANRLGYSREMITFEYPIGCGITYQWCEALIVGGKLKGEKRISCGARGCYEDINENHYEPLPGYDSGIGENGLAMSNKPSSWAAQWPSDVGPIGSLGFPGVKPNGEVAADAEAIWMAVDDDPTCQQPTPLHIRTYGRAMQWSSPLADDFIVFKYFITNTGTDTIKDCYVGVHTDMDCPEEGDNEWMDDFAKFIPAGADPLLGSFLYIWDGDDKSVGYVSKNVAWQGLKMLETPKGKDGKELGQTTLFVATYDDFFVPTQADVYDMLASGIDKIDNVQPHPNDWTQTPGTYGPDVTSLHASGPFDLAPGETVTFTFANIFGANKAELMANATLCQLLYNAGYNAPSAPQQPHVRAYAGDRTVTLYWDADPSESSVDPLTGTNAFEGYRIYRSTDRGLTWGEAIRDAIGAVVGYVPIAQFDLENGVTGTSPLNPYLHLGDDTGLQHKFVDRNLQNGVEYWYAVCAYDREDQYGQLKIPPMENARSTDPDRPGDNTVRVVPQSPVAGCKEPALMIAHVAGISTVEPHAEILDPYGVVDNRYLLTIDDSNPAAKTFSLYDSLRKMTVIASSPLLHGEEYVPAVDGFRLTLVDEEKIAFDAGRSYWATAAGDTALTNWSILAVPTTTPRASDYEVRFTSRGDTLTGRIVPFELWNVTYGQQIDGIVQSAASDTNQYKVLFKEVIEGKTKFTWTLTLAAPPPRQVVTQRDTVINGVPTTVYDTTYVHIGIRPRTGDIAKIYTLRPLTSADRYLITTTAATTAGATAKDLETIRVIPNPYAVTSVYENSLTPWVRELQFHGLPERCTIRIFTASGELVQILHHQPGDPGYRG